MRGHVEAEYVKVYGVADHITVPYIRSNRAVDVKPVREKYVEEAGISLGKLTLTKKKVLKPPETSLRLPCLNIDGKDMYSYPYDNRDPS